MRRVPKVLVGCLMVLLVAASALAQGAMDKKATPAKTTMPALSTFMIESPHTEQECMNVMDEVNKEKALAAWDWGCMAGNHTAYRIVKAKDEAAALAMVPASVRDKAHAYKIMKMTPAMLENAHKHM